MLLFGHPLVESPLFYHINDVDAILHTPPSSLLYLENVVDDKDIIDYCNANSLNYGIYAATLLEAILAHNLQAAYIIVPKELAKSAQNIAQEYLFDAKILVPINDESEIEELALLGIDGAIFMAKSIVKVSS
ncbi:MAG: hypothetical protein ABGW85_08195 [Sulfurimonas sp.]